MFSTKDRMSQRLRPRLLDRLALAAALGASLALADCSGGSEVMSQPLVPSPSADLDTSRAPPQTVTSMPLLPPVPEDPARQPAPGVVAEAPPLPYDGLVSDDEQLRIKADLAATAARAQKN
jgi:hypothetical protein